MIERGNIVLVPFPYSDLTEIKRRPALVISNKHLQGEDVILCAVTSRNSHEKAVTLSNNDLGKGRLPVTSYIRAGKIFTLQKTLIKKIVAKISETKMKEVLRELEKIIGPD